MGFVDGVATGWVSTRRGLEAATATSYKPACVNNRPSDVIAPRDTSVAFKWLLSQLCLDADVDLWNSIKLHRIPYRPNRVVVLGASPPPPALPFSVHPSSEVFSKCAFFFPVKNVIAESASQRRGNSAGDVKSIHLILIRFWKFLLSRTFSLHIATFPLLTPLSLSQPLPSCSLLTTSPLSPFLLHTSFPPLSIHYHPSFYPLFPFRINLQPPPSYFPFENIQM